MMMMMKMTVLVA